MRSTMPNSPNSPKATDDGTPAVHGQCPSNQLHWILFVLACGVIGGLVGMVAIRLASGG